MHKALAIALLLIFSIRPPHVLLGQERLSEAEQAMVNSIDEHVQDALALLERTVNINSGSLNTEGVREVGGLFAREFEAIGFDVRWEDGSAFGRAGHMIAESRGDGPHFLMIGHLDTVFEPDSPFQRYELLTDSTARGPGVSDMKGGNVIILETLRALKGIGALKDMSVTVVLIGDEESSGRPFSRSRKSLMEAADAADIALAFENGDDRPETAVIARRGYTSWKLSVTAKAGHSSQVFTDELGNGAIYEAARILNTFRQELSSELNLTFNPGVILGGTTVNYDPAVSTGSAFGKPNVIAEHTTVEGDLRTISLAQLEDAKSKMQAIVADHLHGTSAEISFSDGYPPLAPTDGNRQLLERLSQASDDLGFGTVSAVDPRAAGAADVSFTAGRVDMALDGLGLLGKDNHSVLETANLKLLPIQAKRAAVLMYRLSKDEGI